jgi:hypothetical protein
MSTLHEINRKAHSILARELGPVDYLIFFRQYETGSGDYTRDRWQWLEGETIDSIAAEARKLEAEMDDARPK